MFDDADLHRRQTRRKWLAFSTMWRLRIDFLIRRLHRQQRLAFCLAEHRQLRRVEVDCLLGLAAEKTIMQQIDLFFQINDVSGVGFFAAHASVLRKPQATFA